MIRGQARNTSIYKRICACRGKAPAGQGMAWLLDRRLFGQTTRMKVLFPRAVLIIEGDLNEVPHSIDMEAIRGALAFLTVREGITVLQLRDATETAAMLRIMARHAQERMGQ